MVVLGEVKTYSMIGLRLGYDVDIDRVQRECLVAWAWGNYIGTYAQYTKRGSRIWCREVNKLQPRGMRSQRCHICHSVILCNDEKWEDRHSC